jgi:hypothetical protein
VRVAARRTAQRLQFERAEVVDACELERIEFGRLACDHQHADVRRFIDMPATAAGRRG